MLQILGMMKLSFQLQRINESRKRKKNRIRRNQFELLQVQFLSQKILLRKSKKTFMTRMKLRVNKEKKRTQRRNNQIKQR